MSQPRQSKADKYIASVVSGEIVTGELVRLACQRHVRDLADAHIRGLRFDRVRAQRVIDFFKFLRHSKGEWANQEFTLEPWQQALTWILFGWVHAETGYMDGSRTAIVELAREKREEWQFGLPVVNRFLPHHRRWWEQGC